MLFQEIFTTLATLGIDALESGKTDGYIDDNRSAVLYNIIQRLTVDTASSLKQEDCWKLVHSALLDWKSAVSLPTGETTLPTILVMQQVSYNLKNYDKEMY